jgi:glycerol-3-phosphate cytidylyltransferase-like family protein
MSKVLVSGCFDNLNSGHLTFIQTATIYGEVTISVALDLTIKRLKGQKPTCSLNERMFQLTCLRDVCRVVVGEEISEGDIDFQTAIESGEYQHFVVNEDGHSNEKEELCKKNNVKYHLRARMTYANLPIRYSMSLPYRIEMAGAWFDQPCCNDTMFGTVITVSIEPEDSLYRKFDCRSGMATNVRDFIPKMKRFNRDLDYAKRLFGAVNPPGTNRYKMSGSQDAIGLALKGGYELYYVDGYWPTLITKIPDDNIEWLKSRIELVQTFERPANYDPYKGCNITKEGLIVLEHGTRYIRSGNMERMLTELSLGSKKQKERIVPFSCDVSKGLRC